MNEVQQVTEIAKGISDYGLMAVTAAFFLLLSAAMMIAIFRWFKSMINRMLEQQECLRQLLDILQDNNAAIKNLAERLEPETQMRIRNLTGFAFDLTVEQVCRLIKRVRKENHIIDHEATAEKIRKSLKVIHEDRNSRFDPFTYHGKPLSDFCAPEWVEDVAKIVESEIYNEDGENNARAYTNVKLAYDNIKTDFYQRINGTNL
jgi:hypothetical protein